MCRKNAIPAVALVAAGAGLLLSFLFSGSFFRIVIGVVLILLGLLFSRKQA